MHLVEQYALSCGVKIDAPSVETSYFPLPFSNYIIIHPSSGMSAKNYDYYNDVLELITPSLKKENIKIVQIGDPKDPVLPYCYVVNGRTTLPQTFFLIKNCLLLLGNDSFSTHVAGGFDKKIVSLYSNLFKECCSPYWGTPRKQVLIQADRKGKKPSFSNQEEPKTVNNINPEEISRAVLRLLKIKSLTPSYKSLHIGSHYHVPGLEIVPDSFSPGMVPANHVINIRLDYQFNPEVAVEWAFNYKTHLVIDQPLDPKYFNVFKKNLVKISVKLQEDTDESYINSLKSLGCNIELMAEDNDHLLDLRLKFIDWEVDRLDYSSKKDLDSAQDICDNTCYKSSKTILSNGKQYSSKAAWLSGQERKSNEKIIDNEEFWKELNYFRLYNP